MLALWVDFHLPTGWNGRDTVPRLEIVEKDALAVGKIVDRAVLKSEMAIEPNQKVVSNASIDGSVSSPARIEVPRFEETFKLSSGDRNRSSRYGSTVTVLTQPQRKTGATPAFRPSSFRLSSKQRPRRR